MFIWNGGAWLLTARPATAGFWNHDLGLHSTMFYYMTFSGRWSEFVHKHHGKTFRHILKLHMFVYWFDLDKYVAIFWVTQFVVASRSLSMGRCLGYAKFSDLKVNLLSFNFKRSNLLSFNVRGQICYTQC